MLDFSNSPSKEKLSGVANNVICVLFYLHFYMYSDDFFRIYQKIRYAFKITEFTF